jgi:hypothetical protein
MDKKQLIDYLKEKGYSFKTKGGLLNIDHRGYVDLRSATTLPKGLTFSNGGDVYLRRGTRLPKGLTLGGNSYFSRFKIKENKGAAIIFKRVSKDYKTQELTENETIWLPGTFVSIPIWQPEKQEGGANKFHGCAFPGWCDLFRKKEGDKYIGISVAVNDFFEWKKSPQYPQKIAFKKGYVIGDCTREGVFI